MHHLLKHINQDITRRKSKDKDLTLIKQCNLPQSQSKSNKKNKEVTDDCIVENWKLWRAVIFGLCDVKKWP